jgi:hypothetical protein
VHPDLLELELSDLAQESSLLLEREEVGLVDEPFGRQTAAA